MVTLTPTLGLQKTCNYFSSCHWNANSILSHNKISLLSTYNTVQKFDIICISEIYLDSTDDDKSIEMTGYNLTIADYLNNQKRGVCLCFKGNLCLRQIDISYFPVFFVRLASTIKKSYMTILYRSPSHTSTEFINFQHYLHKIKQLASAFLLYWGTSVQSQKYGGLMTLLLVKVFRLSL